MRIDGKFGRALLLATALGGGATAAAAGAAAVRGPQAQEKPDPRQQQAELAERVERDFAKAVALWRQIADDQAVDAERRARAQIAMANALQRLGRIDEAKAILAAAAQAGGKAGEEAGRLLEGSDERLRLRILATVDRAVEIAGANVGVSFEWHLPPWSDLLWIGEPALDLLLERMGQYEERSPVFSSIGRVVMAIGGAKAATGLERFVASRDVVLRRSLLEAIPVVEADLERHFRSEPVRQVLLRLCDDAEPRVRALALERLLPVMTKPELLARLGEADERARERALGYLWKKIDREEMVVDVAFLAAMRRACSDPSLQVRAMVCRILKEDAFLDSGPAARELWLDALTMPELVAAALPESWLRHGDGGRRFANGAMPTAARLLEVARRLWGDPEGAVPGTPLLDRRRSFQVFVARCARGADRTGTTPPPDDPWVNEHAEMWELARESDWNTVALFAQQYASISDLPELIEFFLPSQGNSGLIAERQLFPQFGALSSTTQARCIELLEKQVIDGFAAKEWNVTRWSFSKLLEVAQPAADAAVVRFVQRFPELLQIVSEKLFARPAEKVADETLLALLAIDTRGTVDAEKGRPVDGGNARVRLVAQLAERKASGLPAALPAAYSLGLLAPHSNVLSDRFGSLIRLFAEVSEQNPNLALKWQPRYDVAVLARTITECAATGEAKFFEDLTTVLDVMSGQLLERDGPVAGPLGRAIGDALRNAAALGEYVAPVGPRNGPLRDQLVRGYVSAGFAGSESFVLASFDDPAWTQPIAAALQSLPAELVPKVEAHASRLTYEQQRSIAGLAIASEDPVVREAGFAFARSPERGLRVGAIEAIGESFPERLPAIAMPLIRDEKAAVREAVARQLARSFDREAIPLLIELLRDGEESVRKAARESLEQLQYYFDSKSRWERLLSESGLDANSAAEALVKQAKSGATIELRRIAIDSLGTLKVAETLPFLIQLMADPDPTLSAAARAAITKINQ